MKAVNLISRANESVRASLTSPIQLQDGAQLEFVGVCDHMFHRRSPTSLPAKVIQRSHGGHTGVTCAGAQWKCLQYGKILNAAAALKASASPAVYRPKPCVKLTDTLMRTGR